MARALPPPRAKTEYARPVLAGWAWLQHNIRLPARLKKGLWLILFAASAGAFVLWLWDPASLPIATVRVEGVQHSDLEKLQAGVAAFTGAGFFGVDLHAVRQAVRGQPWVQDAAIHREWPDTLVIKVTEQVAAARWRVLPADSSPGQDNGVLLLGESGALFAPPAGTQPAGLPLLQGPPGSEAEVLRYYHALLPRLREAGLEVAELQYRARGTWQARLENGLSLRLGRGDAPIGHFLTVYRQVLQPKLKDIEYVDLRYTNGIAVRWRTPGG
jgi:cell division protein FtsQ